MALTCRAALAKTNIREPRIPVISNVDAQPHSDPDTIKDILARQVAVSFRSHVPLLMPEAIVLRRVQAHSTAVPLGCC